jgi:beta-phosphoglucomutase
MLDGIGLRSYFPVITSAEDVAVSKPDPSCYLLTVQRLAAHAGVPLTSADCLVIEDAPTVIRNVKKVGFRTLGVATSHPIEALADADFAVRSLTPAEVTAMVPQLKVGA